MGKIVNFQEAKNKQQGFEQLILNKTFEDDFYGRDMIIQPLIEEIQLLLCYHAFAQKQEGSENVEISKAAKRLVKNATRAISDAAQVLCAYFDSMMPNAPAVLNRSMKHWVSMAEPALNEERPVLLRFDKLCELTDTDPECALDAVYSDESENSYTLSEIFVSVADSYGYLSDAYNNCAELFLSENEEDPEIKVSDEDEKEFDRLSYIAENLQDMMEYSLYWLCKNALFLSDTDAKANWKISHMIKSMLEMAADADDTADGFDKILDKYRPEDEEEEDP